jgi:F-type H+-transporting ATPase subunit b
MQMINFLILLYLLNKFLVKPLSKFVEKRSLDIKTNIETAENNKVESEALVEKHKDLINQARKEAKAIRNKAEDVSVQEHKQMIDVAKDEAAHLVSVAKKEVKLSIDKAKKELLSEVGEISVALAEEILKRKIDHKDKERIVSEGIRNFSPL